MSEKQKIHIISFQVPYPADYGGAIDVYYKAKALKKQGYSITLHTFAYKGRGYDNALLEIADEVFLYKRHTGISSLLSKKPYIVKSRQSKELLENLLKDNAPILFEGAHTTDLLSSPLLKGRKKFVRTHNVESEYYRHLAAASHSVLKKLFYLSESYKLSRYEPTLKEADILFAITAKDKKNLEKICPQTRIELLPCFHSGTFTCTNAEEVGKGDYVLYNGNLSVEENIKAAQFLIEEVAPLTNGSEWIIAGRTPSKQITKAAEKAGNVKIIADPTHEEMARLINQAAANVLITFQATGIKLKLLNTLYNGGYCIANDKMVESSKLEDLCIIANDAKEIAAAVDKAKSKKIDKEEIERRKQRLLEIYDNDKNILTLTKHF